LGSIEKEDICNKVLLSSIVYFSTAYFPVEKYLESFFFFFISKSIWKVKAPQRVAFFVRKAPLGKILIFDNLRKRTIMVIEWCCMCKHGGESIDHLFLHCEVATKIWSALLQLFGVDWVMPCKVSECLGS
jgi:hypothetical protein